MRHQPFFLLPLCIVLVCSLVRPSLQDPELHREYSRMLQQANVRGKPTVSIGYTSSSTIRVPAGERNALKYFKDAMERLRRAGGGTLIIGPGTFVLENQWNVTSSHVHIRGQGMDKTILMLRDNAEAFDTAGFFYAKGADNVLVQDFTIDGNRYRQTNVRTSRGDPKGDKKRGDGLYGRFGIFMDRYENWMFLRVATRNHHGYGYDPHGKKAKAANGSPIPGDPRNEWSKNVTIIAAVSHGNGLDGITVDMTTGVVIRNCTAYNNDRHGINVVTQTSKGIIEWNNVYNNGNPSRPFSCGIVADTNRDGFVTNDITIRNNRVRGHRGPGVCTKGGRNIRFQNNVISNSAVCVAFYDISTGVVFEGNTCQGNNATELVRPKRPTIRATMRNNRILPAPKQGR